MNTPIAPTILPDLNLSSCSVSSNIESQNLILKTTVVPVINNLSPVNLLTKQGIFVVSGINLNLGEFIIFNLIGSFVHEDSVIFTSILSADDPFGLITSITNLVNGGFSVRIENVGVAILINETVKISYMIIN